MDGSDKVTTYCAKNGLLDLIKDNAKDSLHSTPVYFELEDGANKCEVALMWTRGREKSFTFTNGLFQSEGGTSLTGVRTSITNFIKKEFKEGFEGDMARTGLVYAVACKTPNPSFANQTKTKINNPELRGLAQRATTQALQDFKVRRANEYKAVIDALTREKKAAAAAERARKQVMEASKDIEKNQKKKVFATDKLKDAEFLGEDSTLLLVEGNSAGASMAMARDIKKYGILSLRGKVINALSNPEEKIFQNEEIKLLLSAMNIVPGKYDAKKLRYGKIAICSDADSDGAHIGLLIMAALRYLAPQFLDEGRLCWLHSPLYIVKNGKNESYYFTDEEFNAVRGKIKGEVTRAKGLGALSEKQARASMFTEEFQRMEALIPDPDSIILLEELMGKDVAPRREFVFNKIDFSEVRE
jgi:DNA gyrase subunit B